MAQIPCPDCDTAGSPAGIRRHRSIAHDYPTRAEFIDRFFDEQRSAEARDIHAWLVVRHPDGNWPYEGWNQLAVSRDLAQHKNYPRRWDIACDGHGPGALWVRAASAQPEQRQAEVIAGEEDASTIINRIEADLKRLRGLLAAWDADSIPWFFGDPRRRQRAHLLLHPHPRTMNDSRAAAASGGPVGAGRAYEGETLRGPQDAVPSLCVCVGGPEILPVGRRYG